MSRDPVAEHFASLMEGYSEETVPGSKALRRPPGTTTSVLDGDAIDPSWQEQKTVRMSVAGRVQEFYTIGALAMAVGRKVQAVRKWIRLGYMPNPGTRRPSRGGKEGDRVFTRRQIEAVLDVFGQRGLLGGMRIDWRKHHPGVRNQLMPLFKAEKERVWTPCE